MPTGDIIGTLSPILSLEGTLSHVSYAELSGELMMTSFGDMHDRLRHRDYPDQHPILAITGLQEALDSKVSFIDISIINCGTSTEVI